TNGGLSFNPSVRLNDDPGAAEQSTPAIAVAPNRNVYAVWRDPRGSPEIYYTRSLDFGATWSLNTYVNGDAGNVDQRNPTIAIDAAGTVYVAWTDYRNQNTAPDILEAWLSSGSATFSAKVQVNDDRGIAPQINPSISANAGKIQLAWADYRTGGSSSYDIYTSSSTDGTTWSQNTKVNDDSLSNYQDYPSIAVDSVGDVFAAFLDTRAIGWDVYAATLDVVAPTANAGSAVTADQGTSVAFDGTASADNFRVVGYSWHFGEYRHREPRVRETGHLQRQRHGERRRGERSDVDLHGHRPRRLAESERSPRNDPNPRGHRGVPRARPGLLRMGALPKTQGGA